MLLDCISVIQNGIWIWTLLKMDLVCQVLMIKITEFFQNIKVWARENDLKRDLKFDPEDSALNKFFNESKKYSSILL